VLVVGNGHYFNRRNADKVIKEKPMDNISTLLLFLIPIVLLELGLIIFALVDLKRRERTKGPKWAWALVIIFVNLIGPIVYLVIGREE
jgi:heme/copper-type cytochrome/quinol oxidase subunit 2